MAENSNDTGANRAHQRDDETLNGVVHRLISEILFPDASGDTAGAPLLQRIKTSVAENGPLLPEASRNTARNVLLWTRRGSPFRALLVISVSPSQLQNSTSFFFLLISLVNYAVGVSFDLLD